MDGLIHSDYDTIKSLKIAGDIGQELDRHYPNYLWKIDFNAERGVGRIYCLQLSGTFGVTFLDSDTEELGLKKIVKMVGEMLERYHVNVGRMNEDQILNLKRDRTGHAIFDYHDAKNYRVPKQYIDAYDRLK